MKNTAFVHHVPSVSSVVFHFFVYNSLKGIGGSHHSSAMVISHCDMGSVVFLAIIMWLPPWGSLVCVCSLVSFTIWWFPFRHDGVPPVIIQLLDWDFP